MDPLSITTAVVALTGTLLKTGRWLSDISSKYRLVNVTLTAITSEMTIVSVSLSKLQAAMLSSPLMKQVHLQETTSLGHALDTALIGCSVVVSALQEELGLLESGILTGGLVSKDGNQWTRDLKAKTLWKEDTMKQLLDQLRGQQSSLGLLLQALNIDSMANLHDLVATHTTMLQQLTRSTETLRKSYPNNHTPRSIFDMTREDGLSTYSHRASTAGATEFEFDGSLVDSKVYRRAFMGGYLRSRPADIANDDESMAPISLHSGNDAGSTSTASLGRLDPPRSDALMLDPADACIPFVRERDQHTAMMKRMQLMPPSTHVQILQLADEYSKTRRQFSEKAQEIEIERLQLKVEDLESTIRHLQWQSASKDRARPQSILSNIIETSFDAEVENDKDNVTRSASPLLPPNFLNADRSNVSSFRTTRLKDSILWLA